MTWIIVMDHGIGIGLWAGDLDERLERTALHSVMALGIDMLSLALVMAAHAFGKAHKLPRAQAKRHVLGLYSQSLGMSPSLLLLPTFLSFGLFSPLPVDGYGYITDSTRFSMFLSI